MDGERGESTDNDECESEETRLETRTWINAKVMVALPNIGGAIVV